MSDFRLVCCIPTFREGTLVGSAQQSVFGHVDETVVWEGPAGKALLPDGTPETETELDCIYHQGEWESDQAKRTAMVKWCKEKWHGKPLWILWLDADEVLVNAWALRDVVQVQMWQDEIRGASIANPDSLPTGGLVLRYVEEDGSVSKEWGRLMRGDLIRRYVVSNLIVENVFGEEVRLGRRLEVAADWREPRLEVHRDKLVMDPPLSGEPHFVHRSYLRHPYRQQLRLHEQEHEQLVKLGLPTGENNA